MLKKIILPSLILGYSCCVACAPFGSDNSALEQKVEQQDMQLRQLQPQQEDAWNQLQAMRQELNEVKGKLEAMKRANGTGGIEDKIQQPNVNKPANPLQGAASEETPGIKIVGAPDSTAYNTNITSPVATPMTGSYGLPIETENKVEQVQAPSESTWGQADPKPALEVPQKDISLALFDSGVNSFNSHDYGAAQRSFSDFLKNYPKHTQTAEAQYYLAECQFKQNKFPDAALAYDIVIKKYPKSSSAAGAYLKQALCFSKMGQTAAAKARMQEVISKFPNSPEAARAKSFLKTNK